MNMEEELTKSAEDKAKTHIMGKQLTVDLTENELKVGFAFKSHSRSEFNARTGNRLTTSRLAARFTIPIQDIHI